MFENLRDLLYYPLGILPSIFFSLRFILQWINSERTKVSHINSTFWKLSLSGNVLSVIHYFIQLQYTFFLIQFINSFISRRNLVAMNKIKHKFRLSTEILLFLAFLTLASILFYFCYGFHNIESSTTSWKLHLLGIFGGFLFASRFWFQWWNTEKNGVSQLNKQFWIISIIGGSITIFYTVQINDTVSTFNYLFGMVPYVRNLVLIRNREAKVFSSEK